MYMYICIYIPCFLVQHFQNRFNMFFNIVIYTDAYTESHKSMKHNNS